MTTAILLLLVLAPQARGQDPQTQTPEDLEAVGEETKQIKERVSQSKTSIDSMRARLLMQSGEAATLVMQPVLPRQGYRIESVQYLVDGEVVHSTARLDDQGRAPIPPGPHTITARAMLRGDGTGSFLQTYAFRTQATTRVDVPPKGEAHVAMVVGSRDGQPTLALESSIVAAATAGD